MYDGTAWLVVATDQRLVFLDKGLIAGLKQVDMPLVGIQTIQHKIGWLDGELLITTGGGVKKVDQLSKKSTAQFCATLSELINTAHSRQAAPAPAPSARISQTQASTQVGSCTHCGAAAPAPCRAI